MRRIAAVLAGLCLALLGSWVLLGLRGGDSTPIPAPPFAETPQAPRIVAFGTSLTAHNPWPAQIGTALSDCLGRPVTVTAVAGGGETSVWGLAQLARVTTPAPDIVLAEFTVNDSDARLGVSLSQSRDNHATLLTEILAANPEARIVLVNMSPSFGLRGLLRLRQPAYLKAYRAFAEANPSVGYLDLTNRWVRAFETGDRRALLPDGLHPTAEADAEITAPALGAEVARLLAMDCPEI